MITGCHFQTPPPFLFGLSPPQPHLLIFRLTVGPRPLLTPPPIIWNWRVSVPEGDGQFAIFGQVKDEVF